MFADDRVNSFGVFLLIIPTNIFFLNLVFITCVVWFIGNFKYYIWQVTILFRHLVKENHGIIEVVEWISRMMDISVKYDVGVIFYKTLDYAIDHCIKLSLG